jgi:hypothetical protein
MKQGEIPRFSRTPILLPHLVLAVLVFGGAPTSRLLHAADPVVSNVRASQRPGTKLVDIIYDVTDPDSSTLTVSIAVSANGGATYDLPATAFSGDVGPSIAPGRNRRIV